MTTSNSPLVTLAMPIYNGMPFLPISLEGILSQDYRHIEIILSDNASDDETSQLCQQAASKDNRVTYVRHAQNMGASWNFNFCVNAAKGDLFSWVGSDDHIKSNYVSTCVTFLKDNPKLIGCISDLQFIDIDNNSLHKLSQPDGLTSASRQVRLSAFLGNIEWYMAYGLYRSQTLKGSGLFRPKFGPDVLLLWELLIQNQIGVIHQTLIDYRRYSNREVTDVWERLQGDGDANAPNWLHCNLWKDLYAVTGTLNLGLQDLKSVRLLLAKWLVSGNFRDLLFTDFVTKARNINLSSKALSEFSRAIFLILAILTRPSRGARNVLKVIRLKLK
ncbi:MAG: glycosyltransferase family 2 protein [Acidimicrobiales bacterium]|nr:glycosyltransferase family 2 protein [Acidimicrobiales bacterium]